MYSVYSPVYEDNDDKINSIGNEQKHLHENQQFHETNEVDNVNVNDEHCDLNLDKNQQYLEMDQNECIDVSFPGSNDEFEIGQNEEEVFNLNDYWQEVEIIEGEGNDVSEGESQQQLEIGYTSGMDKDTSDDSTTKLGN